MTHHNWPAPVKFYPLELHLSPSLVTTLRQLAEREGRSLSAVITSLLKGRRRRGAGLSRHEQEGDPNARRLETEDR